MQKMAVSLTILAFVLINYIRTGECRTAITQNIQATKRRMKHNEIARRLNDLRIIGPVFPNRGDESVPNNI